MVTMNSEPMSLTVNIDIWNQSLLRLHATPLYQTSSGGYEHIRFIDLSTIVLREFVRLLDYTEIERKSDAVKIHGISFKYSGLIQSIYNHRPRQDCPSDPVYGVVCQKLEKLVQKSPLPKKSLKDRIFTILSCYDCGKDIEYLENQVFKKRD